MKGVVVFGAGDLRVVDVESVRPGPGEVALRVEWGGICGSDLSYWTRGASGTATLSHPFVLGHEIAGTVEEVGIGVDRAIIGTAATVHPATVAPGSVLAPAIAHRENLHSRVNYLGSAAVTPHVDGGFRERIVVAADRVRALPSGVGTLHGALAEPLGVALHALRQAGDIEGRTVAVSGTGPIGSLVIAAARYRGAARVTAVDIADSALALATQMGAESTFNVANGERVPEHDVVFEASGAPAAIGPALAMTTRGGTLVQVGNLPGGAASVVLGQLVTREITWRGSYRFVDEITEAVEALAHGLDVTPLISARFPMERAPEAFAAAKSAAGKVMIQLSQPEGAA